MSDGPKKKVCPVFLKGRTCAYGDKCEKSHIRDTGSSETSSPVRKDTRHAYRPASPFGYRGVPASSRFREPEPEPEPEPEYEPEPDTHVDDETDDGQFEDADDPVEDTARFSHLAPSSRPSYEGTSGGYSPTSAGSQPRIYPEVIGSPKPIPYVTEIIPHWSQFADPKADGNTPFCKLLAQNQCTQREACRFRHSLTIDEYVLLFKEQQPNLWTVSRTAGPQGAVPPPTFPYAALGTPPQPMPVEMASTRSMGPSKRGLQKIQCGFYPLGQCKNGDKCPFAHVGTPPTNDSSSQGRSSSSVLPASQSSWNTSRSGGSSNTFCRNLEIDGHCRYGDKCHYSHERPNDGQTEQPSSGDGTGWGTNDHNTGWGDAGNTAPATYADDWGPSRNDDKGWSSTASGTGRTQNARQCYDFSKGHCRRADTCKFSHDLSSRDGGGYASGSGSDAFSRKSQPCYMHLQGKCYRADSCRYSHDLVPEAANRDDATATDGGWVETPAYPAESAWTNGGDGEGDGKDNADGATNENGDGWGTTGKSWPDDEVEVEVPEPVDNDDSWSEKPNVHPETLEGTDGGEPQKKVQKPCRMFGQGACEFGDRCRFLHILPEDQKQYHEDLVEENAEGEVPAAEAEEELEDGHETVHEEDQALSATQVDVEEPETEESETELEDVPDLERFMYHCTVRFNSRCSPEQVMTAVDSRKVLLSNLPPDSAVDEIRDLAQRIGEVQDVAILGEVGEFATMSIEFKEHADAMAAVKQLNDQQFASRPIFARLDSRAPVFARSPLHSQMLMVMWPGATVCAWVFYDTITLAKQAATNLNKTKMQDREIGADFERRRDKRGPFPIRVTGMPPGVSKADLQELCKDPPAVLIDLGQPSYTESPEDAIRRELEKFGRIEQFRISSEENHAFNTVAYVTMQSYSVAEEASKALNNTRHSYLGEEAQLKVKHVYHAAYKVLPSVFERILDRLNVLREDYKGKCKIIDSTDGFLHTIDIRAPIDESTVFSEANAALGVLVDGFLLVGEDGRRVWDLYLETPSSAKVIDNINKPSSDVPCFVHCDQRLRCVRIYGSVDGQERGKKAILRILNLVKEQCREITLERPKISSLIGNGLETLRNSIGANKVSLDILGGRLIVRGTAEDYNKANLAVSVLASSTPPGTTGTRSTLCPLCERAPVAPVKLTCRHAYCKACLQFALSSTAQRDCAFFRCIFDGRGDGTAVCDAPLSYVVVRDNLTSVEEVEYMKVVFMAHVRGSNGLFFFCPTPDCVAVYRSGEEGIIIRCAMCDADLCPRCCSRVHDGSLCDERRISMITE
ncbi:hypothetical protein H1R20_g4469, partial [Candolleomyces eurysporus]